jgi:curved DNA-binding protein CbpA
MADDAAVIDKIRQMHATLDEATFYELLEVSTDADTKAINSAFRKKAKEWHVDRYSKYDLGEEKEKLQAIFSKLNEAQRTLTNDASRREYDDVLENGEDDGTDVVAILEAEQLFLRGKNILSRGSYKGAHEMFRDAAELNPDDIDINCHFLYTEYLLIGKDDSGAPLDRARAEEIYKELDDVNEEVKNRESDWLLVFLGVIELGLGKTNRARANFSEALMLNPRNQEAQRHKRLIEMRKDKSDEKGFFGKLLEKLGVSS